MFIESFYLLYLDFENYVYEYKNLKYFFQYFFSPCFFVINNKAATNPLVIPENYKQQGHENRVELWKKHDFVGANHKVSIYNGGREGHKE